MKHPLDNIISDGYAWRSEIETLTMFGHSELMIFTPDDQDIGVKEKNVYDQLVELEKSNPQGLKKMIVEAYNSDTPPVDEDDEDDECCRDRELFPYVTNYDELKEILAPSLVCIPEQTGSGRGKLELSYVSKNDRSFEYEITLNFSKES